MRRSELGKQNSALPPSLALNGYKMEPGVARGGTVKLRKGWGAGGWGGTPPSLPQSSPLGGSATVQGWGAIGEVSSG